VRKRLLFGLAAALLVGGAAGLAPARATGDELPPEEDNGAAGRSNIPNPAHRPPAEVCSDTLTASPESLVLRVLPNGPRVGDGAAGGTLAFTSGVCVYLPPNYADSGLRYPVLYLLHGGGGDHGDWANYGGVRSIMDGLIAADARNAAIVVMPDGNDAQWYDSIDGTIQNERYVLDHVIPYVDNHFRTIADKAGRAIDGLSNGGYGALHLAAKAPDRFAVAGGMSSNIGGRSFDGLGNPIDSPAYVHGSTPADLVANLDGIDVTMDLGTSCNQDLDDDLCLTFAFEQLFLPDNRYFRDALLAARDPDDGVLEYRETEGGHSWRWWPYWLEERHLPFLLARLADPAGTAPAPSAPRPGFRYRSIAPSFSVWGYDVAVQRDVREFLDLRDVTAGGLTVQGSGTATIRTPPLYRAHRRYLVSAPGAAPQNVRADRDGRLVFTVDLGPSHADEQYSPRATALEAAGGYWVVRDVTITPARTH
jgi:S-formylglutathione hydrolase FrmB